MKEEITRSQDDYADPLVIAVEQQVLLDTIAGGNRVEALSKIEILKTSVEIRKPVINTVRMKNDQKTAYLYLIKWSGIAFISGAIGVMVTYGFVFAMQTLQRAMPTGPLLLFFALAGAVLVAGVLHRFCPEAYGEGFPSYRHGIIEHSGIFSLRITLVKMVSGFVTLTFYGNGGIVGPLGRVTAGLTGKLFEARFITRQKDSHIGRIAGICGMAACLGAVFHSPLGAGFFAVEVLERKKIGYIDLFPAVLASSFATFLAKNLNLPPFYHFAALQLQLKFHHFWLIGIAAIFAALAGKLFNKTFDLLSRHLAESRSRHPIPTALLGIGTVFILGFSINPYLLGTSNTFLLSITGTGTPLYGNLSSTMPLLIICLVMIGVKLLGSTLTVASGMNAGFTGPIIIIGMLTGLATGSVFNIPHPSSDSYALIAAGFSSALAATVNVPVSAAILGIELFGLHFGFPAAFAAVIGFQINRGSNLYDDKSYFPEE